MQNQIIRVLFIADIVGQPGLEIITKLLGGFKKKTRLIFASQTEKTAVKEKG